VRVVGKDFNLDGIRFRRLIRQHGLEALFDVTGGQFKYADYLRTVLSCGFILPLVDSSALVYRPYFEEKVTSSISMALATGRIPVVDHEIARLYELETTAVTYRDGDLAGAMRNALALSTEQCLERSSAIQQYRRDLLDASLNNLEASVTLCRA
jgi:hypothetical protein